MKPLLLSLNRTTFISRSRHTRWTAVYSAVYSAAVKLFLTTRESHYSKFSQIQNDNLAKWLGMKRQCVCAMWWSWTIHDQQILLNQTIRIAKLAPIPQTDILRVADNDSIITQFMELHKIKICNEEEEADYMDSAANIADESALEVRLIEFGNSSKTEVVQKDVEITPISKAAGKMSSDSVGLVVMVEYDDCSKSHSHEQSHQLTVTDEGTRITKLLQLSPFATLSLSRISLKLSQHHISSSTLLVAICLINLIWEGKRSIAS
ncbi:hypothetical protein P8452_52499 [Trifolium repens]|nr:hypothetical protein P8452_52499 [Trifolium repens]